MANPAMKPESARQPVYLMCPPDHFEVRYKINPWMRPEEWAEQKSTWHPKAVAQWQNLTSVMKSLGWSVEIIAPSPGYPDMVFSANHAFVLDGKALIARYATEERAGEAPLADAWFKEKGYETVQPEFMFEGGGDALYDKTKDTIYMGWGFRTDPDAEHQLKNVYNRRIITLRLEDPHFYHLDTCFCPLRDGSAIATQLAFNDEAIATLNGEYGDKLIWVDDVDARAFVCNAVVHERDIVLPPVSAKLKAQLTERGFILHEVPLDAFLMAGGASRCLTLNLTDGNP